VGLIACQKRKLRIGATPGDERVESFESSLFPLLYRQSVPPREPERPLAREKSEAYLVDGPSRFMHKEPSV